MKKRIGLVWGIVLAVMLGVPVAQAEQRRGGTAEDYAAIQKEHQGLLDRYNSGDVDGFVESYTDDAWYISMFRPIAMNEDGLRAFFGPSERQYDFQADYELLDLEVMGPVAMMIGRTTLRGVPKPGNENMPPFTEDRIYTALFKNTDGRWLIHRYMESTSPREGAAYQNPMDFCKNLEEQN